MLAPYSEIARSKLASASGACSALAWSSGNRSPNRSCSWRAVASCAAELSRPTGRAPRRASQADTYPVPQPSSMLSRPASSVGSTPACASGIPQIPQLAAAAAVIGQAGFTAIDDLVHGFGGGYLPPVVPAPGRPVPAPDFVLAAGMTVVVQPNVVTRDGRAGVQTGELLLVTDSGPERLHAYPPGLQQVG
jgi:hypothetical protein